MANPKLSTLVDAFTTAAINTALWSNITGGAASLDTVNDQVVLAVPTLSGGINTFGEDALFDATGSSVFAQVGVAANGNGGTKSIMRVRLDANNSMSMRVESGVFKQVLVTAGVTTSVTLPTYDGHAHRWWRLRELSGTFYADTSPDGLTWTNLSSMAYGWAATAITVRFESQASVTEVAGNVTVVSHVGTRIGGQFNPNWPYLEYGAGLRWGASGGDSPRNLYVNVSTRAEGTHNVSRGRQYELDQVQAGTYSGTLTNNDGALDPTNATGPFAGRIKPFEPYRMRAMWPPAANQLTQGIASGGDVGGIPLGAIVATQALDMYTDTDPAGGSVVTSATAFQGSTVLQHSVPSGTVATKRIAHTYQVAVVPGAAYSVQVRVRNVTASTSLQVEPFLGWWGSTGTTPSSFVYGATVTLTGSTTAAWTLITVTGTAPANAYGIDVGVAVAATAAATCSVQSDAWQQEQAAATSAWVMPGAWSPVVGQFTERWATQWEMGGTYSVVQPSAVDAFALLSQKQITDALSEEIYNHSPRFVFALDDPAGSQQVTDATGNFRPASVVVSKAGPGSVTFGNAITATDPVNGVFTGSSGTVCTINNPNPGTNIYSNATYINLTNVGITGPANAAGDWARILAFRYTGPTPTSQSVMWSCLDKNKSGTGSALFFMIDSSGLFTLDVEGPTGSQVLVHPTATSVVDGNWHLAIVSYRGATNALTVNLDGTGTGIVLSASTVPTGLASDSLGAYIDPTVGGVATWNFKGDLAFAAEFNSFLTDPNIFDLQAAWRNALAGDSTDVRYARLLRYAGYLGPTSIQTGLTRSMGPLTGGSDAVSALQGVVDTEAGAHYVSANGTVTFRSRSARYNALTPAYIFGENTAAGEFPYEDVQLDYDATHLGNQVTVTQTSSGQLFTAQDASSINSYFPRTLTRSVDSSSALECQDAAGYLLSRYKQPATRVSSIKLHPSANPTLWPVCLALELGTRVRVMRRPPGLTATQLEVFVEKIDWSFDDQAEAYCTLQCSPVDLTHYGIFASFHTTLKTSVLSGVTSIVINPGADTTNLASRQLGVGQQLVLSQNTANQETVTISAVGATSPGWTSATLTLTGATTKAHTAGDVICEPLPAGTTDPTTWDTSAIFDSVAFAY